MIADGAQTRHDLPRAQTRAFRQQHTDHTHTASVPFAAPAAARHLLLSPDVPLATRDVEPGMRGKRSSTAGSGGVPSGFSSVAACSADQDDWDGCRGSDRPAVWFQINRTPALRGRRSGRRADGAGGRRPGNRRGRRAAPPRGRSRGRACGRFVTVALRGWACRPRGSPRRPPGVFLDLGRRAGGAGGRRAGSRRGRRG